jgi:hypothetical protein
MNSPRMNAPRMNVKRSPETGGTERHPERQTAQVVPFAGPARRFRRADADTPRGAILLFTGIRYERMPEPDAPAPRLRRRS